MKKSLLMIICVFNCILSFGQVADNTNKRDLSNIYNQAIIQYFNYLSKDDFQISDTIYFFEDEFGLTDSLMETINEIRIISVKQPEIEELVKSKNGVVLYKLFPMEYENQKFHVSLVPYSASYEKSKTDLFFSTYGGYWINFKFEKGRFKFIGIDNNSI